MTAPLPTTPVTHPARARWRPGRLAGALVLLLATLTGAVAAAPAGAAPGQAPTAEATDAASRPSVFAGGTAVDHGSTADITLSGALKDLARTPSGDGYWLLGADG